MNYSKWPWLPDWELKVNNMNKSELKQLVTESVLNFLNDARHWNDIHGVFNFVDDLPDTIKAKNDKDVEFEVPITPKDKPLFDRGAGKTPNTFKLNKKEN